VSPAQVTAQVKDSTRLAPRALDQFDNEIKDVTFTWAAQDSAASIDGTGWLTAGTKSGTYKGLVKVTATQGTQAREALIDVTIVAGPLSKVAVEPSEATLDIGASHSFSFKAFDEFGNEISDALASWTALVDAGVGDAGGGFTAGTKAGAFPKAVQVEVVKGIAKVLAAADVFIRPDPLATVKVQPNALGVAKGASQQFTAAGFDKYGNEIAGIAFLCEAAGGQITQTGLFFAGRQGGRYQVKASATFKASEQSASSTVSIPLEWIPVGNMTMSRAESSATVLTNGKVLIVAGPGGSSFKAAELYDPATRTFTATGSARCDHGAGASATRLPDGRVLLAGGSIDWRCAEIYDPSAGAFSLTGDLQVAHSRHTATLLTNGTILIAGGEVAGVSKAIAELYDPVAGTSTLRAT
jgi:hypothetical protein